MERPLVNNQQMYTQIQKNAMQIERSFSNSSSQLVMSLKQLTKAFSIVQHFLLHSFMFV